MALCKRMTSLGLTIVVLTLTTAAAGASSWRWVMAGVAAVVALGLTIGLARTICATLGQSVEELSRGAQEVAAAAGQVSSSSHSLAQGASEQAASLEETSASSEELSSMTQSNADNARMAAEVMQESERLVASANQTLAEMVTSMTEINNASDKIARIIKVIDEIAFQTNILALNAAVEAARAGEAGMGFAVVADEVRNLAQRSAQAAKDTATIIEESIARSSEGGKKLDQVKGAISAITESSSKIKTLVDEVSAGSQEQAQGFTEITNSISQMEHVTQQAAASAEQSASASEELTAQAQSMQSAIRTLRELVEGRQARTAQDSSVLVARSNRALSPLASRCRPVRKPAAGNLENTFPMEDDFR